MKCLEAETVRRSCPPPAQSSTVLLISTGRSDADLLRSALEESDIRLTSVRSYRDAVTALGRDAFTLIVCEEHLPDGCWKDVLGQIAGLTEPPRLVVMAPEFSESLYGEALNLGAWEVLLRPIQQDEARRILQVGCDKFAGRRRPAQATASLAQMAAAAAL
jgi:DNA-binding NtrC family response regulator